MEKKVYVCPDICIVNMCEDLCAKDGEIPVLPLSQYPQLAKEQTFLFIEDDEEDNDTWIIEE
jgi:hypothetical protein